MPVIIQAMLDSSYNKCIKRWAKRITWSVTLKRKWTNLKSWKKVWNNILKMSHKFKKSLPFKRDRWNKLFLLWTREIPQTAGCRLQISTNIERALDMEVQKALASKTNKMSKMKKSLDSRKAIKHQKWKLIVQLTTPFISLTNNLSTYPFLRDKKVII